MEAADRLRLEEIRKYARESQGAIKVFFDSHSGKILQIADLLAACLRAGGKIVLFGNGGSAADAQHLAAEFSGRYLTNRKPLAAIALTTDTSSLTAIGNDFGFERVYERQVLALVRKGDVAVGISTSGASENVLRGLAAAKALGAATIGFAGRDGGRMGEVSDHLFVVAHESTPIIQQVHITLGHVLCGLVEKALFPQKKRAAGGASTRGKKKR